MNGIRVGPYRSPGSFARLFTPILGDLGRYWWDDVPLDGPGVAEDAALAAVRASLDPRACVPPRTLLPRFARHVKDFDWCAFHGFAEDPGPARAVLAGIDRGGLQNQPPAGVEVLFQNVDGASWLLFAREGHLLEAVEAHARRLRGCRARRVVYGGPA